MTFNSETEIQWMILIFINQLFWKMILSERSGFQNHPFTCNNFMRTQSRHIFLIKCSKYRVIIQYMFTKCNDKIEAISISASLNQIHTFLIAICQSASLETMFLNTDLKKNYVTQKIGWHPPGKFGQFLWKKWGFSEQWVAQACSPRDWEAEAGKAQLGSLADYIESSRQAWFTKWRPCVKITISRSLRNVSFYYHDMRFAIQTQRTVIYKSTCLGGHKTYGSVHMCAWRLESNVQGLLQSRSTLRIRQGLTRPGAHWFG